MKLEVYLIGGILLEKKNDSFMVRPILNFFFPYFFSPNRTLSYLPPVWRTNHF